MQPLTPKQAAFVREYLIDLNASAAVRRAGYKVNPRNNSDRVTAHENLAKPHIAAAIQAAVNARAKRTEITADRVLTEIAKLAFANLMDYFKVTSAGDPYIDLTNLTPEQGAALTEIQIDEYMEGRGDDAREVKRIRVKMGDKKGALELLARHLNLFGDVRGNASGGELDKIAEALANSPPAALN